MSLQWVVFVLKMYEFVEADVHTYHYCHFEYVVLIMCEYKVVSACVKEA